MVAPFLALLTLGTVDVSRAVIEKLRLQQAASRTIEMASVSADKISSATSTDDPIFQSIRAEAAAAANVSTNNVTVSAWLECNHVEKTNDYNGTCADNEEVGRYASVSITNGYSPWFASSLAGLGWNVSQAITIAGKASVRVQ